eukprot:CAMPEP_0114115874 /NCGR_PEP_ID=MMETSP0043_2-20121206/4198_1 /TAXON_ID=464988 /ORGANISM="Hemiselmis andersenii, Strain CCMP644" /LENGTH=740 /DNA_ID=CAMNT_0001208159 /DNA_START=402 /DNA_END=2625 /DNA_ORIENTATION=+
MRAGRSSGAVMEECANELAVLVRPSTLGDAVQLIELNKSFRREMAQWEAGFSDEGECQGYPVLDFEDVQYILEEEHPTNLMVLCRRLEGEERCIGYSYSYSEPWESTTSGPSTPANGIISPRVNRGKGQKKQKSQENKGNVTSSLYIAELFISEAERGLGLGELLLAQTLNVHSHDSDRSHLFVSSKNVGAVRCYLKHGYQKGLKPSGDLAHDLVMELPSSKASVAEAAKRFDKQLKEGTVGARKRRPPKSNTSSAPTKNPPPSLTGAKASSSSSSDSSDSRSSSRLTTSASPPNTAGVMCPRALRARSDNNTNKKANTHDAAPTTKTAKQATGRTTRASILASDLPHTPKAVAPVVSGGHGGAGSSQKESKTTINGRQRKFRNQAHDALKAGKGGKEKGASGRKGGFTVYEDPVESEGSESEVEESGHEHRMERRSKAKLKFMLTLFSDGKRKSAEDRIRALGGEVISSDSYDHRCTHLISARPATTEKFLCATAAGKHILQPSYVEDSFEVGYFLAESDYKWSNSDAPLDSLGAGLAQAPNVWRKKSKHASTEDGSMPTGCFDGVVALVLSTGEKQMGYKRILEAGGAEVLDDPRELVGARSGRRSCPASAKEIVDAALTDNRITHVFVSRDVKQMVLDGWDADGLDALRPACEALRGEGVKLLYEEYIVEKIVHNVDLRAKNGKCLILDIEAWFADVRKAGRKRKAAGDEEAGCPAKARAKTAAGSGTSWLLPVLWR